MDENELLDVDEGNDQKNTSQNSLNDESENDAVFCKELGNRIRTLRLTKGLTIRKLSSISGLSANALSLIENGNSRPCVNTLRQISRGLQVPVVRLFQINKRGEGIVYTRIEKRTKVPAGSLFFEDLSADLIGNKIDALIVTMPIGHNSSTIPITHSGVEFAYCLHGKILYKINDENYLLTPGDSISFLAQYPHECDNLEQGISKYLLIITNDNADELESLGNRHFLNYRTNKHE